MIFKTTLKSGYFYLEAVKEYPYLCSRIKNGIEVMTIKDKQQIIGRPIKIFTREKGKELASLIKTKTLSLPFPLIKKGGRQRTKLICNLLVFCWDAKMDLGNVLSLANVEALADPENTIPTKQCYTARSGAPGERVQLQSLHVQVQKS